MGLRCDALFALHNDRGPTVASLPDGMEKLELYALFKQATDGDVSGSQPSRINFVARAKWDARNKLRGMSADDARQAYIDGTAHLDGGDAAGAAAEPVERKVWPAFTPNTGTMLPEGAYNGKIALVTGGGTGLGRGMATTLSRLGATVAIASRRLEVLEATAAEITAETGNPVHAIQLNVRDGDMVVKAMDQLEADVGLPDVVINNAVSACTQRLFASPPSPFPRFPAFCWS